MTTLSRVVVALASVGALGLGATSAHASPDPGSSHAVAQREPHRKTFTKQVTDFNSRRLVHLDVCVHFNYHATFKVRVAGTTGQTTPPAYDIWDFKNPRMIDPSLDVYFTKTCAFGSRKVRVSRLTAKTYVGASALTRNFCNFNPSVSVSFPWAVSVGVAPTCGSESSKRASRTRILEPKRARSRFTLSSTGTASSWHKTSGTFTFRKVDKSVKLCFSGRYYFDVQNAAGSKSEDLTVPGSRGAMCLPVAYWAWLVTGRSY